MEGLPAFVFTAGLFPSGAEMRELPLTHTEGAAIKRKALESVQSVSIRYALGALRVYWGTDVHGDPTAQISVPTSRLQADPDMARRVARSLAQAMALDAVHVEGPGMPGEWVKGVV